MHKPRRRAESSPVSLNIPRSTDADRPNNGIDEIDQMNQTDLKDQIRPYHGGHERFMALPIGTPFGRGRVMKRLCVTSLASQGIEPLLPTVKRLSQWKDRKKEIEVPLFSGYCFVRFASEQKLPVLKTIGVVDIVGAGHCPEPIPDEEIGAIKTLMTSVLPYDSHPYLHEGMASR